MWWVSGFCLCTTEHLWPTIIKNLVGKRPTWKHALTPRFRGGPHSLLQSGYSQSMQTPSLSANSWFLALNDNICAPAIIPDLRLGSKEKNCRFETRYSRETLERMLMKWKLLAWVTELSGLSVQGAFWANPVEIPVFPSPTGYMLTSFGFSSLIWGIFHNFLKIDGCFS